MFFEGKIILLLLRDFDIFLDVDSGNIGQGPCRNFRVAMLSDDITVDASGIDIEILR